MTDMTPLQIAQDAVRGFRNEILKDTDWAVLPDSPLSTTELENHKLYRQYLRDLPTNITDDEVMSFEEADIMDYAAWLASTA
jgi:hypothetical protein